MTPREPSPIQKRALEWAQKRSSIALFMEMRLGKSLVAIRWMEFGIMVLVIAPKSTHMQWQKELREEGKQGEVYNPNYPVQLGWTIISPEMCLERPEILTHRWNGIILDESITAKNVKAQITSVLIRETKHVIRKAILSGLPNPEDPLELVTQFLFLQGEFMGYTNYYQARNALTVQGRFGRFMKRGMLPKLTKWVARNSFRADAGDIGKSVKRRYAVHNIPFNAAQKSEYKRIWNDWEIGDHDAKFRIEIETALRRLSGGFRRVDAETIQAIAHNKLWVLMRLLISLQEKRQRAIIWFHFNEELEMVARACQAAGIFWGKIVGNMPALMRGMIVQKFNETTPSVLLLQLKCCRYGLTLSAADFSVYFSLPWSLNEWEQSNYRAIGFDKKSTLIHVLLSGRMDRKVFRALRRKRFNAMSLLDSLKGEM